MGLLHQNRCKSSIFQMMLWNSFYYMVIKTFLMTWTKIYSNWPYVSFTKLVALTKIIQTSAMHKATTTSVNVNVLLLCKFCFTSDVRHLMSSHIGHGVVIVFRFHDVVPMVLYSNHKCIVECTICFNISCDQQLHLNGVVFPFTLFSAPCKALSSASFSCRYLGHKILLKRKTFSFSRGSGTQGKL